MFIGLVPSCHTKEHAYKQTALTTTTPHPSHSIINTKFITDPASLFARRTTISEESQFPRDKVPLVSGPGRAKKKIRHPV